MSLENKIYKHIQSILPQYDDLEYCNMYKLPETINADIEYIFKLKTPLFKQELMNLEERLLKDIEEYCNLENEPLPRIVFIFSEI